MGDYDDWQRLRNLLRNLASSLPLDGLALSNEHRNRGVLDLRRPRYMLTMLSSVEEELKLLANNVTVNKLPTFECVRYCAAAQQMTMRTLLMMKVRVTSTFLLRYITTSGKVQTSRCGCCADVVYGRKSLAIQY